MQLDLLCVRAYENMNLAFVGVKADPGHFVTDY
jgi:hypothetical protein